MRNFGDVRTVWLLGCEQLALGGIGEQPKRCFGDGFLPSGGAASPAARCGYDRAVAIGASPRTPADESREPTPGVCGTEATRTRQRAALLLALMLLACLDASSLAAGHRTLIPEMIEALKDMGRADIKVVAGGVIPPQDYPALRAAGVQAIFGPGTNLADAADEVLRLLGHNRPPMDEAAE